MKKHTRNAISLLLLLGTLVANLGVTHAVEPRHIGLTSLRSTLDISAGGAASCNGRVVVKSGYTVNLKVELKQDGTTIKTWTSSGSGTVTGGGIYYVTSGHDYVVTATATVYDKDGSLIEAPFVDSAKKSY